MKDADRAYFLRMYSRVTWEVIAQRTQYNSRNGANMAAARYAKNHDLPWPLPPALSRGEIGYHDLRDGEDWDETRKDLGFPPMKALKDSVRHYAKKYKLPWPPRWEEEDE